ncbi:hypothetical protein ABC855_g494 [[Candida] zeylanoides]
MPFYIPISVKIAVTAGALVGGAAAVIGNREKMLVTAEAILQMGADFFRRQNEKLKLANEGVFADNYSEGSFSIQSGDDKRSRESHSGYSSGITTPDASDDEVDDDNDAYDYYENYDLD